MQRLLTPVLLPVVFLTLSCKKNNSNSESTSTEPVQTPVGALIGDPVSYTVNTTGGTFALPDSTIVVTVPAGAVSSATTLQLQEVKNTCTAGLGSSFSLTPHGTVFQKPVSIRFSYAGETQTTIPKALGIAYQDKDGIWRLVNGANVDTVRKTITIQTTHFSNWSKVEWFKLEPASAVLNPGESIPLKVISYVNFDPNDVLTPLISPGQAEAGLGSAHVIPSSFIKKWYVGGVGSVSANGATATYTAPATATDVSTAAVVAELAASQYEQYLLISNITVMNEGVTFRINGGSWIRFSATANYLDNMQSSIANGRQDSAFSILWPGGAGPWHWTGDLTLGSETVVSLTIPAAGITYQSKYEDDQGEIWPSGGTLKIDQLGAVGQYVTGSFSASTCAKRNMSGDQIAKVSMNGYFRIKRTR